MMPTDTSAPAEVVQADREAAEALAVALLSGASNYEIAQAFARHRLNAHLLAADALDAGTVEACAAEVGDFLMLNTALPVGQIVDAEAAIRALSSGKTVGAGEGDPQSDGKEPTNG